MSTLSFFGLWPAVECFVSDQLASLTPASTFATESMLAYLYTNLRLQYFNTNLVFLDITALKLNNKYDNTAQAHIVVMSITFELINQYLLGELHYIVSVLRCCLYRINIANRW